MRNILIPLAVIIALVTLIETDLKYILVGILYYAGSVALVIGLIVLTVYLCAKVIKGVFHDK